MTPVSFILLLLTLLLAGCASVPRDAGFSDVRADVVSRIEKTVQWRRGGAEDAEMDRQVAQLLARPLDSAAAVQVALLNNRALQAQYERLGVAQADLVQAGLLHNPSFGWSRQQGGGITKTNWGLELDFLGLLLLGPQQRLEAVRFEHEKLGVTQAVLDLAAETRKAWAEAVAAEQVAGFLQQVKELAETETELVLRQHKAGNLNRRDLLRQQAFATEAAIESATAGIAVSATRERLNRLMGLTTGQLDWKLPQRLPEVPPVLPEYRDIESFGISRRLDVQMAQKEAEAMAAALKITRDSRFIRVLDIGVETEKATGENRITGPTLKLELPVFDQGQARVSRQEALYRQSEARLYEVAVNARSEIREALHRVQVAQAAAKQVKEVLLPMRRQIVEESTLHYNGMLIGVFELLADARAQVGAVQSEIAALRDYWVAMAELQLAVGGKLPAEQGGGQ